MLGTIIVWLIACDGGSKDSAGNGPGSDDSASDDSGTNNKDDSGDDSGTGGDDSGTGCTKLEWFQDLDHDGYGAGTATLACESPGTDWVETSGDCNDGLAEVSPAATETCNLIDDDCDAAIDGDDTSAVLLTWYPDGDGDGFGDFAGTPIMSCTGAGGYAPDDATHGADCDDADTTKYPGAPELCDDIQQDCATKGWSGDVGVATWYPSSGGFEDWTADMADGKPGAAAKIEISDDGELVICDGTWYAGLTVKTSAATVTGLHGSEVTILSGGDDTRLLTVLQDGAVVLAQGLTMTEGNACYGAAVSTTIVASCSMSGASASWTYDISLTLSDVRIEDNNPTLPATAAVVVAQGTVFALEDSTITGNNVWAVWAVGNPITCSGGPKNDAGIWGNAWGGISILSQDTAGTMPLLFESSGCDFEGSGALYTPDFDVQLQNLDGYTNFEFEDDEFFLCDANVQACAK
jgi:hypothetical protein